MKYFILLIPVLFFSLASHAQDHDNDLYRGWKAQNQSSLFIGNINERMRVSHNVLNSGKGLGFEVGFNPAWLFNRHLLLGVFAGVGMRDVLYKTRFSTTYKNDFNHSFNSTGLTGNDSLVANKFSSLINEKGFHDQEIYYGIIFRLPYKWAPVVKVYTGQLNWMLKTYDKLSVKPDEPYRNDKDIYSIDHRINWGAEIFLFRGYTKIGDYGKLPFAKKKPLLFCTNMFPISFFIEHISSTQSAYDFDAGTMSVHIPQERILAPSFIQQYKSNYYFGFRMSYGCF